MEKSISVIYCTKKDKEGNAGFNKMCEETCGCDVNIFMIHNPDGIALSKIYGDLLFASEVPDSIVVFIHDDVEFLRPGWGKEILRLFNENEDYGIIGVAGSAQFDENGAWWRYDKKFGQVLHRDGEHSFLTAFSPLLDKDLQEVAVIDGLFMAVHRNRIGENFDKGIEGFDFYDIDFCLRNLVAGKCKIGVTTNIRMAHNSIGKLKDTWYKNRDIINERYGDRYPIDILKKKK